MAVELDQIESVSGYAGEDIGSIQIEDGTQTWTIPLIQNDMIEPFVNRIKEAIETRRSSAPTTIASDGDRATISVADEIEKLASLVERGLLTAEEFAAQKAKLLGRSHA